MASQKSKRAGGSLNDSMKEISPQKQGPQKISTQYAFQILEKRIMQLENNHDNLDNITNINDDNNQIENLKTRFDNLEGIINTNIAENNNLKAKIQNQEKRIKEQDTKLSSLSELQALVNQLSMKLINKE